MTSDHKGSGPSKGPARTAPDKSTPRDKKPAPAPREPELQWVERDANATLKRFWPVLAMALTYALYRGFITSYR